jgi:hypothetical protein
VNFATLADPATPLSKLFIGWQLSKFVFLEDDGVGQREKCVGIEEWCVVAFELVVSELFHQWRNRWSLSWKTEDFQVISQGFIEMRML